MCHMRPPGCHSERLQPGRPPPAENALHRYNRQLWQHGSSCQRSNKQPSGWKVQAHVCYQEYLVTYVVLLDAAGMLSGWQQLKQAIWWFQPRPAIDFGLLIRSAVK
jgi:hypothetical protein